MSFLSGSQNYIDNKLSFLEKKFLDEGIQDVSTSISIFHDLIEMSDDGDESDKGSGHLLVNRKKWSSLYSSDRH